MYQYIFGIALLLGGYVTFSKSMGPLDRHRKNLVIISFVSGILSVIFLITGFFIFKWWAPIVGILLSMLLWMIINTLALSIKPFTLLHAFRSHIGIFLGSILCLLSFID